MASSSAVVATSRRDRVYPGDVVLPSDASGSVDAIVAPRPLSLDHFAPPRSLFEVAKRVGRKGRCTVRMLWASVAAALAGLIALPQEAVPQAPAGALIFAVDPTQSTVQWTLGSTLHAVHGTFALKTGNLQFDPSKGTAGGQVVVDASSGRSGNDGRDRKMHKDVLESARFGEITFRPDRITGKLEAQGDSALQVHGIFLLHGDGHELTVPAQVNRSGDHWSASAKFSIPFIEWGLKNPSTWLLKVDHAVSIEVELKGTMPAQPAP